MKIARNFGGATFDVTSAVLANIAASALLPQTGRWILELLSSKAVIGANKCDIEIPSQVG